MLKYLEEAEAERLCKGTLSSWIKSAGYKGCYSAKETRDAVDLAKRWAIKSRTARDLMSFVETAKMEVLVVGMRGGYQCFDSTGGEDGNKAIVYVDLDGRLRRFVRQPHQLHFLPQDCAGLGVNVMELDNNVALLHEFGHAKQWLENPKMFDGDFRKSTGKEAKPMTVFKRGLADPLLHPEGKLESMKAKLKGGGAMGASFASAIQQRATEVWGQKAEAQWDPLLHPERGHVVSSDGPTNSDWLLSREELEKFQPVSGYSVQIEADNIERHEWPICDNLGIPRRLNYRDLSGDSTAKASTTSLLLKLKGEEERAKAPVKVGSMAKGLVTCPRCNKQVKANTVNFECSSLVHKA